MVSVSGYLIGSQEAGKTPLPPEAELEWWYQYYFATERGRAGYEKIPARILEAHLAARLAEVEVRRRHVRSQRGGLRQPGSRRYRDPQLPLAARLGRRRTEIRRSGKPACAEPGHHRPDHHTRKRCQRRASPRSGRVRKEIFRAYGTGTSREASGTTCQEAPRDFAQAVIDVAGALVMFQWLARAQLASAPRPAAPRPRLRTARPSARGRRIRERAMAHRFDAIIIGAGQAGPSLAGRLTAGRHDGRRRRAQAVRRHLRQHRLHADQDAGRERLCGASRAPRPPSTASCSTAPSRSTWRASRRAGRRRRRQLAHGRREAGCAACPAARSSTATPVSKRRTTVRVGESVLTAPRIFINVGGRAAVPDMPGVGERRPT